MLLLNRRGPGTASPCWAASTSPSRWWLLSGTTMPRLCRLPEAAAKAMPAAGTHASSSTAQCWRARAPAPPCMAAPGGRDHHAASRGRRPGGARPADAGCGPACTGGGALLLHPARQPWKVLLRAALCAVRPSLGAALLVCGAKLAGRGALGVKGFLNWIIDTHTLIHYSYRVRSILQCIACLFRTAALWWC